MVMIDGRKKPPPPSLLMLQLLLAKPGRKLPAAQDLRHTGCTGHLPVKKG